MDYFERKTVLQKEIIELKAQVKSLMEEWNNLTYEDEDEEVKS